MASLRYGSFEGSTLDHPPILQRGQVLDARCHGTRGSPKVLVESAHDRNSPQVHSASEGGVGGLCGQGGGFPTCSASQDLEERQGKGHWNPEFVGGGSRFSKNH